MGAIGLALLAGLFSTLSPCVLPLMPIVIGAAVAEGDPALRRLPQASPSPLLLSESLLPPQGSR